MLRLLAIECRRTATAWLAPLLVALYWWQVRYYADIPHPFWAATSVVAAGTATLGGPLVAGVAAWVAGRSRGDRLDELLATVPRPAPVREIARWAATALWGLLAYGVVAGSLAALTWRRSIWGDPDLGLFAGGALAPLAFAAAGHAIGRLLPARFVAPLVGVGALFAEYALRHAERLHPALDRAVYLSPAADWNTSVWYGVLPRVAAPQALFFAGATGLALALLALGLERGRSARPAVATAVALAVTATGAIPTLGGSGGGAARDTSTVAMVPYTPVCSADPFPVCVHPAFRADLPALSREVNLTLAPLLGLPDAPIRAEHAAHGDLTRDGRPPPGVIPFAYDPALAATFIVERAVIPPRADPAEPLRWNGAQLAFLRWLWGRSPVERRYPLRPCTDPGQQASCRAAERFARLDPVAQRAWLEANFPALKAGALRLEDLP